MATVALRSSSTPDVLIGSHCHAPAHKRHARAGPGVWLLVLLGLLVVVPVLLLPAECTSRIRSAMLQADARRLPPCTCPQATCGMHAPVLVSGCWCCWCCCSLLNAHRGWGQPRCGLVHDVSWQAIVQAEGTRGTAASTVHRSACSSPGCSTPTQRPAQLAAHVSTWTGSSRLHTVQQTVRSYHPPAAGGRNNAARRPCPATSNWWHRCVHCRSQLT